MGSLKNTCHNSACRLDPKGSHVYRKIIPRFPDPISIDHRNRGRFAWDIKTFLNMRPFPGRQVLSNSYIIRYSRLNSGDFQRRFQLLIVSEIVSQFLLNKIQPDFISRVIE